MVTCSDASMTGAGICFSAGLSRFGSRAVVAVPVDPGQLAAESLGLLALFDGIGGDRRALELLGVIPGAFYASEIDRAAMRCVSATWPQVEHLGAIETVTDEVWRAMVNKHPSITMWLVAAGFPCQDLSPFNRIARKGLSGERSGLYLQVVRVVRIGQKICQDFARVLRLGENVASAEEKEVAQVSKDFKVRAVQACAGDLSWCRRPRVYWPDWPIAAEPDVAWSSNKGRLVARLSPPQLPPLPPVAGRRCLF